MKDLTHPPNQGFHKAIKNEPSGKAQTLTELLSKCDFSKFKIRESAQEKDKLKTVAILIQRYIQIPQNSLLIEHIELWLQTQSEIDDL